MAQDVYIIQASGDYFGPFYSFEEIEEYVREHEDWFGPEPDYAVERLAK